MATQDPLPAGLRIGVVAVSYTHLDVYKRQMHNGGTPSLYA